MRCLYCFSLRYPSLWRIAAINFGVKRLRPGINPIRLGNGDESVGLAFLKALCLSARGAGLRVTCYVFAGLRLP